MLVCSQSHQAVRNVLECLHAIGGYRMARHGRDEDLKGVERLYSERSLGATSFPNSVLERCRKNLDSLKNRAAQIQNAIEALGAAKKAADHVALVQSEVAQARPALDSHRELALQKANLTLRENQAAARQADRTETLETREHRARILPDLTRSCIAPARHRRLRDRASSIFRARHGRDPERAASPERVSTARRWLTQLSDLIVPTRLLPHRRLESRFARHAAASDKLTQEERSQQSVLDSLEKRLEARASQSRED